MAPRLWKRSHPVHEAVKFGRHDIRRLRQLLESNKVDVNTKDANGATPLHIAVSSKAGEALRLLLAHASIDPNAQDANGKTALHMAISSNCTDNVRKLLEHPLTDVTLSDNEGRSPLHYAVEVASSPTEGEGMLSLLLRHGPVNYEAQDNYQRTALSWALHLGLEAAVVALISDREPVSEVGVSDVDGNTALHKADGRAWDSAVLVRLLAHQDKAVVNAKNRFSETALHIAARADRDTFLGPFISAGADLEARRDSDGATPFHVAVQYGSYEFASGLWSPGMRRLAFAKDFKGNTPLHLAAARGDVRMVASIVGRDGLVAQVNNEQEAAVDVAARHGHAEAVVVLLRAETVESEAVRSKRRDTAFRMLPQIVEGSHVSNLIEWLAWEGLLDDLKSVRAHDDAPLPKQCITFAAERGHAHVVQYLVDEGVDPNTCLHLVGTPLAVAAKHGQVGVLKFLISLEQIKPNLGLQGGDTPLMSAIRSREFQMAFEPTALGR
ncbi:hypothetical protein NEMBOFW57_008524 [Staphylotrichum longicolle]|uniref:Ankyrin repeat protein n=1 Tax=Staphylotrichum longicolle TaxID=669026 RepID=A0AAD4HZ03_9PEZI|nr:hypothetical protein NEMBOFW57_008524 [Staphylotrichum longicolle]